MSATERTDFRGERVLGGAAALWASAFVLLAMVVVQAGRGAGGGAAAVAGSSASQVADLTVLTAAGGDNEDVLCVLDRRSETFFVYGVVNRTRLDLLQTHQIGDLFAQARGAAGGGGRP